MSDRPFYEYGALALGEEIRTSEWISVNSPYDGSPVGRVCSLEARQVAQIIERQAQVRVRISRYERSQILQRMADAVAARADEISELISREAGLSLQDTRYEAGRVHDVLRLASVAALDEDAQVFPCDISPIGKARRIYTMRQPLNLVSAITPFNHPMNQVAHKIAPAIAAGTKAILKPSERTPLSAYYFARLAFESGLPPEMLSVVNGPMPETGQLLARHPQVQLVSFTGSSAIGKQIASDAGYKKLILELGGSSAMIVLPDYDLDEAVEIAVGGIFKNSGQRCTSVRRFLVEASIAEPFAEKLAERAASLPCGDPLNPQTAMGTLISEAAAKQVEARVQDSISMGARLLAGHRRKGALYPPTVLDRVENHFPLACFETFGPVAAVMRFDTLDEAIRIANDTSYGLSGAIVTHHWPSIQRVISELETGTVNVNEAPGFRLEWSPFGGIRDSGLGYKEGVREAMKAYTYQKTYSLPWEQP